jgi:deoxyribonuclease V
MRWPGSIAEARKEQELLSTRVKIVPYRKEPQYVAGVDAAFSEHAVFAAACLYRYPDLGLIEQAYAVKQLLFPYVPGFLSFREAPAIIAAVEKLSRTPDIILVDGQGIAHPRGIGIASHIGVVLDIPTIGCAKSRLIGEFNEPGVRKGNWSALRYEHKIIGTVVRTRDRVKPVFVSPGHKMNLHAALRITLACTVNYRIPEPLRCADMLSKKLKMKI